jgi:hypothetical protein
VAKPQAQHEQCKPGNDWGWLKVGCGSVSVDPGKAVQDVQSGLQQLGQVKMSLSEVESSG